MGLVPLVLIADLGCRPLDVHTHNNLLCECDIPCDSADPLSRYTSSNANCDSLAQSTVATEYGMIEGGQSLRDRCAQVGHSVYGTTAIAFGSIGNKLHDNPLSRHIAAKNEAKNAPPWPKFHPLPTEPVFYRQPCNEDAIPESLTGSPITSR